MWPSSIKLWTRNEAGTTERTMNDEWMRMNEWGWMRRSARECMDEMHCLKTRLSSAVQSIAVVPKSTAIFGTFESISCLFQNFFFRLKSQNFFAGNIFAVKWLLFQLLFGVELKVVLKLTFRVMFFRRIVVEMPTNGLFTGHPDVEDRVTTAGLDTGGRTVTSLSASLRRMTASPCMALSGWFLVFSTFLSG